MSISGLKVLTALLLAGGLNMVMAVPVVQLGASLASPQPLDTTVTLTANATDTDAGTIAYRFEIGAVSGSLTVVRDYSVMNTFVFTPTVHEGNYTLEVIARNNTTGKTTTQTITPFRFNSLVTGANPVVSATANPLVAFFSAPSCGSGLYMRVNFVTTGGTIPNYTSFKPCAPPLSMNFIVAGMHPNSSYTMHSEIWDGTTITPGTNLTFTTGTPSITFPTITLKTPATTQTSLNERVVLIDNLTTGFWPIAVDLLGNPLWYYVDPNSTVSPTFGRPVAGGTILMIASGPDSWGSSVTAQQVLREIDLAGNTLRETNAGRLAEQVIAMSGEQSSCQTGSTLCLVGALHHEAMRLPNGHTIVLADEEKLFTDGTQGSSPSNPVDVIGDLILDLDTNFQLAWYWDSFAHLNVNRAAVLGETCKPGAGAGCPSVFLAPIANDWLHSNAVNYSASSGDLLLSMRHQDWIVKIDYANGTGSGNVLWTLGQDGDFTMYSNDPYPWFTHQHDPGYELGGTTYISMFDNGNTRVAANPNLTENSRGYVLYVNESTMSVATVLLANMGVYSSALGKANILSNGDFHFDAGFITPGPNNQAIEVTDTGTVTYNLQVAGSISYRSFRMTNLYTPLQKDLE